MYKDIDRVTFPHCQKVLPLTYDNSLSYYEAICKLVERLNQVIAIVNQIDLSVLDELRRLIEECIEKNLEQDETIADIQSVVDSLSEQLLGLSEDVNGLSNRVDSISSIVNIHSAQLENHEERISELEKYQSQLLLKKEYANDQDFYVFDFWAEQYEREEV